MNDYSPMEYLYVDHADFSIAQVSLWKESPEGQWVCVSDVYKGQGQEMQ